MGRINNIINAMYSLNVWWFFCIKTQTGETVTKTATKTEGASTDTPTKEASASAMVTSKYDKSMNFEWIFITVGIVCAVLVSVSAFIIMKKHSKFKSKFEGLNGGGAEVSKDYQVNVIEMRRYCNRIL